MLFPAVIFIKYLSVYGCIHSCKICQKEVIYLFCFLKLVLVNHIPLLVLVKKKHIILLALVQQRPPVLQKRPSVRKFQLLQLHRSHHSPRLLHVRQQTWLPPPPPGGHHHPPILCISIPRKCFAIVMNEPEERNKLKHSVEICCFANGSIL